MPRSSDLDDAALRSRRLRTQRSFYRLLGGASPGARVLEFDGVTASVVPATPERSVFNSVVYGDSASLLHGLGFLSDSYRAAGVDAWTVWVPDGDQEVATELGRAGHVLDAEPEAMGRTLDGIERPGDGPLDWTRDGGMAEVAHVNDRAYAFDGDPFTRALSGLPAGGVRPYLARVDGAPAAVLLTHDHAGDCGVWAVATVPEARGRGLTSGLLRHALADAREEGCSSTTLEATQLGRPVYAGLGYRELGRVEMWERRR